jgi:hypothetical protein
MKRRVQCVLTSDEAAQTEIASVLTAGLHPEVYVRTENVEQQRLTLFIIMRDDFTTGTHGKNGIEALPMVEQSIVGLAPCDILENMLQSRVFKQAGPVERKELLCEVCEQIRAFPPASNI